MKPQIAPYIEENKSWTDVLQYKHLLFDTDAIVSIISFQAISIFEKFKELEVTNCYIHPVSAELLATDNVKERALRGSLLSGYNFILLPLTHTDFSNASKIQLYLASKTCFPSPVDLYLGGKLLAFQSNNIYLITCNLKDFQHPLFERVCNIILQNEKQTKILSVLQINPGELV